MKAKRIIKWMGGAALGSFLLLSLLSILADDLPLDKVLPQLMFGWWAFLRRNLPQMTWNWNLIATGILCSAGVIVIGNRLLVALFAQVQWARHPERTARPWRWPWTMGLYVAVWLLFVIAMGATGVFRHATWLLANDQPWYKVRYHVYMELKEVAIELRILLGDHQQIGAAHGAFLKEPSFHGQKMLLAEEFNVLFYAGRSNQVAAFIIIPRTSQLLMEGKFATDSLETDEFTVRPLAELPQTIAEMEAKYPPGK
jgi:hypothetical protein